jgi:hypothetical protein
VSAVVRFIVVLVMSFCFRTTDVGSGRLVVVSFNHASVAGGSVVSHSVKHRTANTNNNMYVIFFTSYFSFLVF